MNAMSVSPVKPQLNAGNHAVSPTATNLTKSSLSSTNNFTPLNLIPEAKPVTPMMIAPNTEKSVDLCIKQPTSNGTVFSISETNPNVFLPNSQNCVENYDTAENLSTDNTQKSIETIAVESKSVVETEEMKTEEVNLEVNESLEITKEIPCQVESVKANEVGNLPIKEEIKESVVNTAENIPNNIEVSPVRKEPIAEINKSVIDFSKMETLSAPKEKVTVEESNVNEEENKSDNITKSTSPRVAKHKAKPLSEPVEEDVADGRKSKRVRLPTQPYQSPIPELQFIAKLNTPIKTTPKNSTEKIIAFYKNEFLAVRNPEGSFYICQTFQNIHKNSTKIKIRWFTNLPQDIFTPDFYDTTEFDCILTNVTMTRVEKDRWKLPDHERIRIENILKRALDVEKGIVDQPSITEEHPDGLDLSLFKDEAQLKKKKKKPLSPKKKPLTSLEKKKQKVKGMSKAEKTASTTSLSGTKKSSRLIYLNQSAALKETIEKMKIEEHKTKKEKKEKKNKRKNLKKSSASVKNLDKNTSKAWEPSVKASNSSRVVLSLRKEDLVKSSAIGDTKTTKRTSNVSLKASSTIALSLPPQKRRKEEPKPATSNIQSTATERPGKVRNAGSAVTAKINSAAMRTTKDKERKTSTSSTQRRK